MKEFGFLGNEKEGYRLLERSQDHLKNGGTEMARGDWKKCRRHDMTQIVYIRIIEREKKKFWMNRKMHGCG